NQCNIDDDGDTESVYAGGTSVTGAEIPPDNEVVPDDYYCPVDGDTPTIENPINELSWDSAALRTDNDQNLKFYKDTLEVAEHCTQIFSVNVTFANASQDSDSDATGISLAEPDGFGFDPADNDRGRLQVLEYLHGVDLSESLVGKQNITSYFVTVPGGRAAQANDWARAGGSGSAIVVEEDPEELVRKLGGLFSEIQGVSTSFVSASVPANVFNRAEVLNEVLLAIFEPDEDNAPFWVGNVKKLKTRKIQEQVYEDLDGDGEDEPVYADLDGDGDEEPVTEERKILVDVLEEDTADPTSAINPLDGRIRKGALTFWTRTGSNDEYLPPPDPSIQEDELEFIEGTDGRKVDRGGAGQVKPGYLGSGSPGHTNNTLSDTTMSGPRKLLTEPETSTDGTPDPMLHLDAAALDSTLADELLTDGRTYPGSDLSYGDYLFQTVMDDCADCGTSYNDGTTTTTQQETAVRRVSNLIRFARGWDVDLDTALSADIDDTGKRAWWQADPLHSRPIAVNYGVRTADFTEERPDVRVIVSGNDGMVQMIRDGRLADGSEDGIEAWAFLPREFVPLQKRLLEGTLGVYNPGIPDPDGHEPLHPYAMDGSPTVLRIDNDLDGTIDTGAGDRVYLFIGQRRGGKRYYALDISDPDQPKLMWSIGKDDADGEFAELAQSWSLMRAGVMAVDESGTVKNRPVLIFTGGYNGDDGGDGAGDLGKDSRVPNRAGADGNMGTSDDEIVGTDDQEGNALFIINGLTGELIWRAAGPPTADAEALADPAYDDTSLTLQHPDLVDSVASTPAVLDADGDGFIERVYFPDTGGNVWRMDAHSPDRSTWTVNKLFEGGRHFQDDGANDRRFFHKPDVVLAADEDGKFDAVIVTSGDRARPLATDVENWVYMIKDRADYGVSQPSPITHSDLADLTDNCLQDQQLDNLDLTNCDDGSAGSNLVNGWKVQLRQCEAQGADPSDHCGEKGLAEPVTLEGTIFFTTYLPVIDTIVSDTPSTCGTQEGAGLLYGLDLQTAGGVLDFDPSNNADGVQVADRFVRLGTPG
ncbi:MAG TPA: hypothetical protein VK973_16075, partial [Arenicellales bacterium]|nr:hypothetical protein [Arenicellales bacterium]